MNVVESKRVLPTRDLPINMVNLRLPNLSIPYDSITWQNYDIYSNTLTRGHQSLVDQALPILLLDENNNLIPYDWKELAGYIGADFSMWLSLGFKAKLPYGHPQGLWKIGHGLKLKVKDGRIYTRFRSNFYARSKFQTKISELFTKGFIVRPNTQDNSYVIATKEVVQDMLISKFNVEESEINDQEIISKPYGLIKIKENKPISVRPIVPVQSVIKKVSSKVRRVRKELEKVMLNAFGVKQLSLSDIKNIGIRRKQILSGDIKDMFNNIDISKVIEILNEWDSNPKLKLFVFNNKEFIQQLLTEIGRIKLSLNGKVYKMKNGIPQGYCGSPFLSSIILYDIFIVNPMKDIELCFYVDDCLFLVKGRHDPNRVKKAIENRLTRKGLSIEWLKGKFCDSQVTGQTNTGISSSIGGGFGQNGMKFVGKINPVNPRLTKKQLLDLAIVKYNRFKEITYRVIDNETPNKIVNVYGYSVEEIEEQIKKRQRKPVSDSSYGIISFSVPWGQGKIFNMSKWKVIIQLSKKKIIDRVIENHALENTEEIRNEIEQKILWNFTKVVGKSPIWAVIKSGSRIIKVSDESSSVDENGIL